MAIDLKAALAQRNGRQENAVMRNMAEMFGFSEQTNADNAAELPIERLIPYKNHPFRVDDDRALIQLSESIRQEGLLHPVVVRRSEKEGYYEILSGHRRCAALQKLAQKSIQAVIVDADDELASRIVIAANYRQRQRFYPSELAKAYQLRHDMLKQQRRENSTQWNLEELIEKQLEEEFETSKSRIYLYLRFNYLIDGLLDMLDRKKLNTKAALELSYLKPEEQEWVYQYGFTEGSGKLDQKTAAALRQKSSDGELTSESVQESINAWERKPQIRTWEDEFLPYEKKFKNRESMKQAILQFLKSY